MVETQGFTRDKQSHKAFEFNYAKLHNEKDDVDNLIAKHSSLNDSFN